MISQNKQKISLIFAHHYKKRFYAKK